MAAVAGVDDDAINLEAESADERGLAVGSRWSGNDGMAGGLRSERCRGHGRWCGRRRMRDSWSRCRLGSECGIVRVIGVGASGEGVGRRRFGVGDDWLRCWMVRARDFAGLAADGGELYAGDRHGWE